MATTKIEKVYCWTGNHEIDPAQWMSQAGMCRVCYDSIESDVLTAHAEPVTARDTEPRMPAVSGGKPCGVEGCGRLASPGVCCDTCGILLCLSHTHPWDMDGRNKLFCPEHKKGGG